MPVINGSPFVMTDCTLSVLTDDFAKLVSKIELVPEPVLAEFVGGKPDAVFQLVGATKWTLNLSFAQDWASSTSLSNYLFNNIGQQKVFVFEPISGGKSVTVTVVIVPGSIGGDINAIAQSTVALKVIGQPVIA